MRKKTLALTLSAMFVALGVLFPIMFHSVGLGSIFLPMFWPIAAAAFFLDWPIAVAAAVLTPLVSSLFTGMPPVSPPIMQMIMLELSVLAYATVAVYRRTRLGLFWPLLIGLIFSRIMLILFIVIVAPLFGLPPKLFSLGLLMQGLPGVMTILIVTPIIVSRIKHEPIFSNRKHVIQA